MTEHVSYDEFFEYNALETPSQKRRAFSAGTLVRCARWTKFPKALGIIVDVEFDSLSPSKSDPDWAMYEVFLGERTHQFIHDDLQSFEDELRAEGETRCDFT